MLRDIIDFKFERKSEVIFYKEYTKEGSRFGVQYYIGNNINDSELEEANTACDTIAYREHYRAHLGKYPKNDLKISFRMPGRAHNVLFDIAGIEVYRVAELIAEYLNVTCTTSLANPIIVTT